MQPFTLPSLPEPGSVLAFHPDVRDLWAVVNAPANKFFRHQQHRLQLLGWAQVVHAGDAGGYRIEVEPMLLVNLWPTPASQLHRRLGLRADETVEIEQFVGP